VNRILVVDDSESIQMLYSLELADEGYEVFASKCDARVFDQIEQTNPDLIILDVKPDEYDGRKLLQDIRSAWSDTPVILSGAYPTFSHRQQSHACEYSVVKSSDLRELKHKVKMALGALSASQPKGAREEF